MVRIFQLRFYDYKDEIIRVLHFLNFNHFHTCLKYLQFSARYSVYYWGVPYV